MSYLLSQKCLKNIFVDNFQITLIIFFQNVSGYSPKHCLFSTIDKWMKTVDNKVLGALLTDLSKAFGCICHDILVAKLNAYDMSFPAIKWYRMIRSCCGLESGCCHLKFWYKACFSKGVSWNSVTRSLESRFNLKRVRDMTVTYIQYRINFEMEYKEPK